MEYPTPLTPEKSSPFSNGKILKIALKTFHHFFGSFDQFFGEIDDPRVLAKTTYSLPSLLFSGVWLFLCRLGADRQVKFQLHTEQTARTFAALFRTPTIPHGDTLKNTFAMLAPAQVSTVPAKAVRILIRKRALEFGRFKGYYLIAIDGTGVYVFSKRHCDGLSIHQGVV